MNKVRTVSILALVLLLAAGATMAKTWKVPKDFATIQEAVDAASDGDTIRVQFGEYYGAEVDKQVTIKGVGQAVINDGPPRAPGLPQGFRMLAGSDGATISHLIFDGSGLDLSAGEGMLAIMNGGGVADVTVTQCTFLDALQAISNWRGNGWEITHNKIIDLRTRNGGGIGILIADYTGGIVADNLVAHNTVTGTLHVYPGDGGGYSGSGIVLYADFRYGWAGAEAISYNRVVKNKVAIESDTPAVVDIAAFELTDTQSPLPDPYCDDPVIFDNSIGFNNWRGTEIQMALTPPELEDCNWISRNLGDNRGHGLHPKLFK